MPNMSTLGPTGDTRLKFDPTKPEEINEAREQFNILTQRGFTAYTVKRGKRGEVLNEFDPSAGEIILVRALEKGFNEVLAKAPF